MILLDSDSIHRKLIDAMRRARDEDEFLLESAVALKEASRFEWVNVILCDESDTLVLRASTLTPVMQHRLTLGKGVGLTSVVVASNQPLFIESAASADPRYAYFPGTEHSQSESTAVAPIRDGDRICGVVEFSNSKPHQMSNQQRAALTLLASSFGDALAAFQSIYRAGNQMSSLGALSEVSRIISTSPYVEEILQLLVNFTAQQFNFRVCTVRLLDETRGELVLRATQAPAKAYQRKRAIKLGESIAGRAIAENKPIIVHDVRDEADYIGHDLAAEQGLRSMICIPLTIQQRAVGVLSCYTSEIHTFSADEVQALETLAKQAAVSIEHAKLAVRHTLMQEMHHRVKNNLQQIASLLRLQMRHTEYKSLEEALSDVLSRILAIASVHDLLSREDLDHVGLRSIAETLVQHQQASLLRPDQGIRFEVRGTDTHLNMNQATQVALVLNELISNAVEHGFASGEGGEIHVNLEEKEDVISLWVSNSGDTLPADFVISRDSHLGLQIVESLSGALGGSFSLRNVFGWAVAEVTFTRQSSE